MPDAVIVLPGDCKAIPGRLHEQVFDLIPVLAADKVHIAAYKLTREKLAAFIIDRTVPLRTAGNGS
jgi:hypothetical protein